MRKNGSSLPEAKEPSSSEISTTPDGLGTRVGQNLLVKVHAPADRDREDRSIVISKIG